MPRRTYAEMTPEQQNAYKRRSIESSARTQKQIPLKYKKEVADVIYSHAKQQGTTPVTWIKAAIAEKYQRETGRELTDADEL